ncbi:MAG TPA: CoA-transferase [Mycobacteriales bacterium]|nr:CoA-transferase [Mycobacteriales bacterium]
MDKVVGSAADAVAGMTDGDVLGISGFGVSHGFPTELIAAGAGLGLRDLTIVCNSLGSTDAHPLLFAQRGQARKLIAAFSARAGRTVQSAASASSVELEVELVPQGILVERLRAAGAGMGPFYSPVGADTELAHGKERRRFGSDNPHNQLRQGQPSPDNQLSPDSQNNQPRQDNQPSRDSQNSQHSQLSRDFVLEYPLHLDVAFIYAAVADRSGNLGFRGTSENFGPSFAKGAKLVIAQVDEIVETGEISLEDIDLPGIFVDRVVRSRSPRIPTWSPARGQDRRRYGERFGLTPGEMGARIAALLPRSGYVNLGVGLPTQVSDHLQGRDITLHGENGVLGYTDRLSAEAADPDAFNAGGEPVRLSPGASVFDSVEAFEMARGGHLSAVVLGAFEVDSTGSFANWTTPEMGGGALGGAMDLLVNPGKLIIAMRHTERSGRPKVVTAVHYPVTGTNCVDLVVTDIAVIERDAGGLVLRETAAGFTVDDVVARTEARLRVDLW